MPNTEQSVGDTGIEPVTSSVSGKRATAAPAARNVQQLSCLLFLYLLWSRNDLPTPITRREVETGFEPVYTDLQSVASPLGHSTGESRSRFRALRPSPSGRRDSNPRPSPWQGDALPTEPRPRAFHALGAKCECNPNPGPVPAAKQAARSPDPLADSHPGTASRSRLSSFATEIVRGRAVGQFRCQSGYRQR